MIVFVVNEEEEEGTRQGIDSAVAQEDDDGHVASGHDVVAPGGNGKT